MRAKLAPDEQMTIEEFLAFTDTRPDDERWELIEGVAVMSPSPTLWHQVIAGNVFMALGMVKLRTGAPWVPALGIGTRVPVSPNSLPQPDAFVVEHGVGSEPSPVTDDALVLFEVLSKSNTRADQAWRKRVYASVPNCAHYVTVAQSKTEVVRYDRASNWEGVRYRELGDKLELPALGRGVTISLADIYRWTPLGEPEPV
jgi:Uma2 family endonuclease